MNCVRAASLRLFGTAQLIFWLCISAGLVLPQPTASAAQSIAAQAHAPLSSHQDRAAAEPPSVHSSTADFSREPLVIERFFTAVEFRIDGTSEKNISARIRVQSDAGAQQLGELVFPYDSSREKNDIHFVRVTKPDGKIVTLGPDSITDVVSPIVRDAPAFSDLKESRVAVPSLAPGDILEFEIVTRDSTPPATDQFWFQHRFLNRGVVLDERLTVNVPLSRTVHIKSPSVHYLTRTDEKHGQVVYEWKRENLARPAPGENRQSADGSNHPLQTDQSRPPDVEVSTFPNWRQVANWYSSIEHDRDNATPEIKAKAVELTRRHTDDLEKIESLYDYVSTNVRYVAVPFGEGPYQSHTAAEVFSNRYGDSNDKAALLAAMLQSIGIQANTAFISSSRNLDTSFPSPGPFDHALTTVRLDRTFLWMDEAPEVAPFRLLAASLRNKSALLVAPDASSVIAKTPPDPPFTSTQNAQIEGSVSDLGKLHATIHYTLRGDTELVLRLAFHRTPEDQWKELAETILNLDGIHGEVASVTPSDPTATKDPFHLDIAFSQVIFLDWASASQKVTVPLAAMGLPDLPGAKTAPIEFGSPLDVTTKIHLELPAAFSVQPPAATSVSRDYADYKSSYRFENHILDAERSLAFKMRELPASRTGDYAAFGRAVQADENEKFIGSDSSAGSPVVPTTATLEELLESGTAALNSGNPHSALPLFQRAVALDPQNKEAWDELGLANLSLDKFEDAAAAFRKQLEANPRAEHSYYYLGLTLQQQRKTDDAALAFRKQLEMNPLDKAALASLGALYIGERDFASALPLLDKATILSPDNAALFVSLGQAYAATGEGEKALVALKQAVALSPAPRTLNAVAYTLASNKLDLDVAHNYSSAAVAQTAAPLRDVGLTQLKNTDLRLVSDLGNDWDTLGWVNFQEGDLVSAEIYLRAAWLLEEQGEIADHLAQLFARRAEKDQAIRMYTLALAAPHSDPETRARLTLLLGGNAGIDALVAKAHPQLEAMRTVPVESLPADRIENNAKADFFVLLSPAKEVSSQTSKPASKTVTKVDDVQFIGGSESLRNYTERLRLLDYGAVFPDASPVKIVRRGTLTCSASPSESDASGTADRATSNISALSKSAHTNSTKRSGSCVLILSLPEDVRLAN